MPVFFGASVMLPAPLAVTVNGSIGPVMLAVQLNVVPPIVDVGAKLSGCTLHICCDKLATGFVITGTGFTVAVTSKGVPGQPLAMGVMR